MAARHKKASGGISTAKVVEASPAYDVENEAAEKKKGGKAMGKMHGGKSRLRLDKPGRKTGGRVGADTSPLSSANRTSSPEATPKSNSSS